MAEPMGMQEAMGGDAPEAVTNGPDAPGGDKTIMIEIKGGQITVDGQPVNSPEEALAAVGQALGTGEETPEGEAAPETPEMAPEAPPAPPMPPKKKMGALEMFGNPNR